MGAELIVPALIPLAELRERDPAFLGDLQARRFGCRLDQTRVDELLGNSRRHVVRAGFSRRAPQPQYVFEIDAFLFHVENAEFASRSPYALIMP